MEGKKVGLIYIGIAYKDEVAVKGNGGPNTHPLKRVVMRCG